MDKQYAGEIIVANVSKDILLHIIKHLTPIYFKGKTKQVYRKMCIL